MDPPNENKMTRSMINPVRRYAGMRSYRGRTGDAAEGGQVAR